MTDRFEGEAEERDRTKLVWISIGVVFALMIVGLWFMGRPDPNATMVRARHILVKYDMTNPIERQRALDTISDLRKRILAGEDFGKLAKEYSDDPSSKPRGGDLGFHDPTDFEGDFKDYVMTAPIGQLSEIVNGTHGFHLIEVIERHLSEYDRREFELLQQIQQGEGAEPAV